MVGVGESPTPGDRDTGSRVGGFQDRRPTFTSGGSVWLGPIFSLRYLTLQTHFRDLTHTLATGFAILNILAL